MTPRNAILLLGPTGSGKSPLGDLLSQQGFLSRTTHHLDFGHELRSALHADTPNSPFSLDEINFIHHLLEHGLLLENTHFHLAEKLFRFFLSRQHFSSDDILILNGIPRHIDQANDMARLAFIHALVVLDCTPESIFLRLQKNTGGDRTGRRDDAKSLVERKLSLFKERTEPLIRHFHAQGSSVYRISIDETTTPSQAHHRLLSLTSANPPITLIPEPPQR
jgi:adenylate kinase family enzyme